MTRSIISIVATQLLIISNIINLIEGKCVPDDNDLLLQGFECIVPDANLPLDSKIREQWTNDLSKVCFIHGDGPKCAIRLDESIYAPVITVPVKCDNPELECDQQIPVEEDDIIGHKNVISKKCQKEQAKMIKKGKASHILAQKCSDNVAENCQDIVVASLRTKKYQRELETKTLEIFNALRKEAGQPELQWGSKLAKTSQAIANQCDDNIKINDNPNYLGKGRVVVMKSFLNQYRGEETAASVIKDVSRLLTVFDPKKPDWATDTYMMTAPEWKSVGCGLTVGKAHEQEHKDYFEYRLVCQFK